MNVKQAIQSSANVIRVTSVSAGDVYKRFDDSYDDRITNLQAKLKGDDK